MASRPVFISNAVAYKFTYKTTAFDIWQLSMYGTYGSPIGVVNIIFTIAMLLLTGKFWVNAGIFIKILLIFGICLFTVIQPLAIYRRAKKQIPETSEEVEISFDDYGLHIKTGGKGSKLKWNTIQGVSKKPTMIIIFAAHKNGFVLTNKVLGKQKQAFYDYLVSKTNKIIK